MRTAGIRNETDDRSRILGLIYEAAATPALWPSAMAAFADATKSVEANFIVFAKHSGPRPGLTPVCGIGGGLFTPEQVRAYLGYYAGLDPLTPILNEVPAGALVLGHEHMSEEYVARSEYHQDFQLPAGSRHTASWRLEAGDARVVRVTLHKRKEPFVREQIEPWARVARHASHAVRLGLQLFGATAREEIFRQAVDHAGLALLMVDASAKLLHCSAAGCGLLESGVFKLSGRRLRTASPDETLRLHGVCMRAATGRGLGAVRIADGRGGHCVVRALPAGVRADNPYDRNHSGCALLFVVSPEPRRVPDANQIRLALRCSPAEAEVAALLVSGFSPKRVACERLVSLTTVRTQIRALFANCGVSRLSELVRLLTALA